MSYFSGRHGSLRFLGKPVAKVRDWSLTLNQELLETTKVDGYAPTYVPGMKGGTGSATLLYYRLNYRERTEFTPFDALIKALVTPGMPTPSDRVRLELGMGEREGIAVDAYITRAQLGSTAGELSMVGIDFTVDGDLAGGLN
jgi:hypothetical protein